MKKELIKQWEKYCDYLGETFNSDVGEILKHQTFSEFMYWLENDTLLPK